MESVDECLPPTEKETSDRSMSGLLAQGDNYKCVSVLTISDRIKKCDRYTNDRRRMHEHRAEMNKKRPLEQCPQTFKSIW